MKKAACRPFVLLVLLSFALNSSSFASRHFTNEFDAPASSRDDESNRVWENFRKNDFPFHIQTIAYDEKTKTLIVSEPPPHVTLDGFKKISPALSQTAISKEHPIGYDGWVKDLIVTLPEMEDSERRDLFDRINEYLFHTTYKTDVLSLPVKKSSLTKSALDVTVTSADLQDWLIDKNEVFESVLTGDRIQFNSIISQKKGGVYFSEQPSLIIWAIDRKKKLNDYRAEARQFALDSDLIVGAISNADMLAIVGRERILPTDVCPPLRTETILQLASTKNPELAQSYERMHILAGKFNERDDWAPIYLSDELIGTEYGSLLNITDQILKRWSQKGTVNYAKFEKYEDPERFPFGDKTLVEFLKVKSVTFNWNTTGVGYSTEVRAKQIFALNRTGALPVSYLGETKNNYSVAEDKGYEYFAEIGDSNLTRVVQYAAVYQIFQSNPVNTVSSETSPSSTEPSTKTVEKIKQGLYRFKDLDASKEGNRLFEKLTKQFPDLKERISAEQLGLIIAQVKKMFADYFLLFGDEGMQYLAARLAAPREIPKDFDKKSPLLIYITSSIENDKITRELIREISFSDLSEVKDFYVKNFHHSGGGWIQTPSIVVSWVDGEKGKTITGGHNLGSKITIFRTGRVLPGKVRIINQGGKQIIITNPGDAGKVSSLVRTAAIKSKSGNAADLKLSLERELAVRKAVPPKPKPEALEYPKDIAAVKPKPKNQGWFSARRAASPEADLITVTKRADGAETVAYRNREITAYSATSRNDYISSVKFGGGDPAKIRMVGYQPNEANAMLTSLSAKRGASEGKPNLFREIKDFAGGTKYAKDYNFAQAKIGKPQFETVGQGIGATTKVRIDIDVPLSASRSALSIRIENTFKGIVTKVRQQQIIRRFEALFARKFRVERHAAEKDIKSFADEVESEIRKEFPELLDIKVKLYEANDIDFGKNWRGIVKENANAE